jgi:CDGSH-type Zn-finger protein
MDNKGVTFKPEDVVKPKEKTESIPALYKGLTSQLSEFNRPRCGCGKSKNPPYCDGSHARG